MLIEGAFAVASTDDIDFLRSHAAVYCGSQHCSWHATSIQLVPPKPRSLSFENSPQNIVPHTSVCASDESSSPTCMSSEALCGPQPGPSASTVTHEGSEPQTSRFEDSPPQTLPRPCTASSSPSLYLEVSRESQPIAATVTPVVQGPHQNLHQLLNT